MRRGRSPRRGSRGAPPARGSPSTCVARPGSGSRAISAHGPPAEVDGGARERVVHRHDGVAVARDPAPVAERAVERLAERERRVLGGVVVAGLEVARALEHEVEPAVEGELLEEVVVEPGAGRDAHAPGAVERRAGRRSASPRSRARAARRARLAAGGAWFGRARARARRGAGRRPRGRGRSRGTPPAKRRTTTRPSRSSAVPSASPSASARRGSSRARAAARARARAARRRAARAPRPGPRRPAGRRARRARGAAESVETGAGAWRRFSSAAVSAVGERVADARAREAERLRERAQHDHAVVDQPRRGLARVLEVRLVDDERPRLRQRIERAGRVVRPAAEREHRVVVADVRARELDGDAKERVRRLVRDRDRVARPGERARAEQDQVVGARAEHDVLRRDARVARDRGDDELRVAAVRILVDARASVERARPGASDGSGSAGTLPSKRTISTGSSPARRASSAVDGAHLYAAKVGASASSPHRRGVRGHALGGGERLDDRPHALEPVARQALHRHRLEERLEAEAADRARPAARRQDVVAAGRVVAGGDRRVGADEDRAGVADARRERLGARRAARRARARAPPPRRARPRGRR